MQAFPICFSQICLSLNGYKYSFFSGMFRCSDTTFVTFENRKFCFLDWLYFCFTCIQFSRCKLFWRFDPSKPNNEYLSQPCVEKCLRKTIRNASHYSCICSANLPKTSLSACLASNPFWQKLLCSFSPLFSIERRWSSRTFRYGYLVTTSPQSLASPSAAPSLRLGHRLRVLPTPMVWRAVCTRPGNVFTATFWFAITSDSSFV